MIAKLIPLAAFSLPFAFASIASANAFEGFDSGWRTVQPAMTQPRPGLAVDVRVIPLGVLYDRPRAAFDFDFVDLAIGTRLDPRWFVGVVAAGGALLDSHDDVPPRLRLGLEARYAFSLGTAWHGPKYGPKVLSPAATWVGARLGAEAVDRVAPHGAFFDLNLGKDAFVNDVARFGVVFTAGVSIEPKDAYGAARRMTSNFAPYFSFAWVIGFG